ncbi:50S ribosomal protein L9 [bacterium HR40]|nr:50S ribosomal protein L9 [bacterium HR40]
MQVILLERVPKLGQMGDVVDVRPGYARNFLVPKGKALYATKEALAAFEARRKQLEAANIERRSEAEKIAEQIRGRSVVIIRQAGETGQLYGSVTARDIAEAFTAEGITLSRQQVLIDHPIKQLGVYRVRVALHPEVEVELEVNVARSGDEAAVQAGGTPQVAQASDLGELLERIESEVEED